MVPDRQMVRTDGRTDRRTYDAKTISLRLCRGITSTYTMGCLPVRKIIHSLKLVVLVTATSIDFLIHFLADNQTTCIVILY